jgi:hypothetical protein
MTLSKADQKKYKDIILHRTRIVAYAFYPASLSLYPITVAELEMDPADARLDLDFESGTEDTTFIPADAEAYLMWAEYKGSAVVRNLGIVHSNHINDRIWMARAAEALSALRAME